MEKEIGTKMEYVIIAIGKDETGVFYQMVIENDETEVRRKLSIVIAGIKKNKGEFLFSKESFKESFKDALADVKKQAIEECEQRKLKVPLLLERL